MGEDAIIVAIVFGSILGMIAIPMLINLAKKWIDRKEGGVPEEEFNRLARAFMDYKKNTQRRLQNLEAIISDDEPAEQAQEQESPKQIDAPNDEIEIEDSESVSQESQSSSQNNLRNMLRE